DSLDPSKLLGLVFNGYDHLFSGRYASHYVGYYAQPAAHKKSALSRATKRIGSLLRRGDEATTRKRRGRDGPRWVSPYSKGWSCSWPWAAASMPGAICSSWTGSTWPRWSGSPPRCPSAARSRSTTTTSTTSGWSGASASLLPVSCNHSASP